MTHVLHEAVNQSGLIMQLMNIIKDYEMHHLKARVCLCCGLPVVPQTSIDLVFMHICYLLMSPSHTFPNGFLIEKETKQNGLKY